MPYFFQREAPPPHTTPMKNANAIDQFFASKADWLWQRRAFLVAIPVSAFALNTFINAGGPSAADVKPARAYTESELQEQKVNRAASNALVQCEVLVQQSLKNPDSYKRHAAPQWNNNVLVYSANNSFGGRIRESFDCAPIVNAAIKQAEA